MARICNLRWTCLHTVAANKSNRKCCHQKVSYLFKASDRIDTQLVSGTLYHESSGRNSHTIAANSTLWRQLINTLFTKKFNFPLDFLVRWPMNLHGRKSYLGWTGRNLHTVAANRRNRKCCHQSAHHLFEVFQINWQELRCKQVLKLIYLKKIDTHFQSKLLSLFFLLTF